MEVGLMKRIICLHEIVIEEQSYMRKQVLD